MKLIMQFYTGRKFFGLIAAEAPVSSRAEPMFLYPLDWFGYLGGFLGGGSLLGLAR